ncbi:H+/Cl- antiporter ClcA [Chitinophaga skermanii]|uniref:H+/Cl-antiporter ClcA n=1 Tax=Chitinophaga skermanii TaxID=331697 RepID=A0A327QS10_9BACT|nr:voltage-gated chloride channel family protein [Chitinophaga skermanii]RAJ06685.1 H+/Cl- antiporter ClcA [Chitinophaga skermanii]
MQQFFNTQTATLRFIFKWTLLAIPLALLTGSLVALFLWSLDEVTKVRYQHTWLLYLLPLGGILIYFLYKKLGKNSEKGNNLILDEIHTPGGGIPKRMAPLVLATTLITHLFGGSAGREGTAVQMGGSVAAWLGRVFRLEQKDVSIMLMCGIAAGFGAVFGTPITGAIFALEVLIIGTLTFHAMIPCLVASFLADVVCAAWGIHHTKYSISSHDFQPIASYLHVDVWLLLKVIVAGACFGLTSRLFAVLTYQIKLQSNKLIPIPWLIPAIGGCIVIGFCFALGTTDYTGLGVSGPHENSVNIVNAFHAGGADTWSWLWKLLFTAITLGMGFKGGEVTPLFFMGAALGNTLAILFGTPVDLMAGLGFIAVFAGATNTPLACTIMGVELFGGEYLVYYALACFNAYIFSGKMGIYSSQRSTSGKIL